MNADTQSGLVLAACSTLLLIAAVVFFFTYEPEGKVFLTFDEEITQCMAEPDQTLQSCVEAYAERFSPI